MFLRNLIGIWFSLMMALQNTLPQMNCIELLMLMVKLLMLIQF